MKALDCSGSTNFSQDKKTCECKKKIMIIILTLSLGVMSVVLNDIVIFFSRELFVMLTICALKQHTALTLFLSYSTPN